MLVTKTISNPIVLKLTRSSVLSLKTARVVSELLVTGLVLPIITHWIIRQWLYVNNLPDCEESVQCSWLDCSKLTAQQCD